MPCTNNAIELERDQRERVIRTWRLATLLLAATSMGTARWLTLLPTLHPPMFGKMVRVEVPPGDMLSGRKQ